MVNESLKEPVHSGFRSLLKSDKVKQVSTKPIGYVPVDLTVEEQNVADSALEDLGYAQIGMIDILEYLVYLLKEKQTILPEGKKNKQQRGEIVSNLLKNLHLEIQDNQFFIFDEATSSKINLGDFNDRNHDLVHQEALQLANDSMVLGKVIDFLKGKLPRNEHFALEQSTPYQLSLKDTIQLAFTGVSHSDKTKKVDKKINTSSSNVIKFGILRESLTHASFQSRREVLRDAIDRHEIISFPKFELSSWPTDVLMSHIKKAIAPNVLEFIARAGALCDPQDLKYQVAFRLTTLSPEELFENGSELEEYLHQIGAYTNWRNILTTDPNIVSQYRINQKVLDDIIEEQYRIIQSRLSQSELPLEEILFRRGIFAESGWVIQKKNGIVLAVQEESATATADTVPLEFREVDINTAKQYHNDLHYIHTPRADLAFGLFIKGEELPFSVLALEKVDRSYKQNVLLINGYDPRKCYDLTRLYSKPGTPGNTSSSMFSLAFAHLKSNYPETQAVLSSFMPSYATGVSMTSGGFDNPVLVKPLNHMFAEREIDGVKVFEHLTQRRSNEAGEHKIWSQIPLLPTIELLSSLQQPRFTPLRGAENSMYEVV